MTLTVVSNPVHGGKVTVQPPLTNEAANEGAYYPTDNVTLTAVARSGYRFAAWTGDVAKVEDATQETIIVAMGTYYADNVENIQLSANFEKIGRFPWTLVGAGSAGLLATALGLAVLVRRRREQRTEIPPS